MSNLLLIKWKEPRSDFAIALDLTLTYSTIIFSIRTDLKTTSNENVILHYLKDIPFKDITFL